MKKAFKAMLSLALIIVLVCSTAFAASYSARLLKRPTTMYSISSKSSLGTLPQGTRVTVTKIEDDWARVSYADSDYYVKMKDLYFSKRIKAVSTKSTSIRFVTKKSYKEGTYYKGTLAAGVTVYVVGLNGNEALIENDDGDALGYVKLSALEKV